MGTLRITNEFMSQIREAQQSDHFLQEKMLLVAKNGEMEFKKDATGLIRYKRWICIPQSSDLKAEILEEAHKSHLSFHPRMTKMYQDSKRSFWWLGMKSDVAEYVAKCLTCQKTKAKHQ